MSLDSIHNNSNKCLRLWVVIIILERRYLRTAIKMSPQLGFRLVPTLFRYGYRESKNPKVSSRGLRLYTSFNCHPPGWQWAEIFLGNAHHGDRLQQISQRALRDLESVDCASFSLASFLSETVHQAGGPPAIHSRVPLPFKDILRSNAPVISPSGRALLSNAQPAHQELGGNIRHKTCFPKQSCSGNSLSFTVSLPYNP